MRRLVALFSRISVAFVAILTSKFAVGQISVNLAGGTGSPGSAVVLNLSLNAPSGSQPASLQWTVSYSASDFSAISVVAGNAATAAGKSLSCNNLSGTSTCVVYGLNANQISSGVVAIVTLTISPSTLQTSSNVQLTSGMASSATGGSISSVDSGAAVTIVQPSTIPVTVQTSVAGSSFAVDGTTYTSTQVFNWSSGSAHTISVTSPQSGGAGTQYVWSSWSDGGSISHTVAPTVATTYTATLATQYLLTTSVAPAGSGTVTAAPSSATGYYTSGTAVQLAAAASMGSSFLNWSGSLSGSVNPQSVTMTAPRTVSANFQASTSGTTFITSYVVAGRAVRNDFSGWVGTQLTVGSSAVNVSSVGRLCLTGNSGTHTVKFASASTGLDVTGGSAVVNMAGCTAGQFVYTPLAAPISLQAGASYFFASLEASGGDTWYDLGGVSTTSDATVPNSVYNGGGWTKMSGANTSYGPPNFQYSLSAASGGGFITAYTVAGRAVRNDFGGWVGTQLNVGSSALNVSSVGRLCLTGNSGTHTVKFASASTGLDVTGGSAVVNMAGCTAGQFVYTPLAAPISLQAGASYFFASMEASGGDTWYDLGGVSTTSDATVPNSVYNGGGWTKMSGANTSYGPPNFQYSLAGVSTIPVTVQTSIPGSSFVVDGTTYSSAQVLNWTPGSSHTISVASPQSGGTGTQIVWSNWSDGGLVSHTVAPTTATTFTATLATQYLLTAGVSPAGSGTIAALPVSSTGYYNSGTAVQLTAVPSGGSTFLNWSGSLSGSTNPQTVSMTAPRTVSANFQVPATSTAFITAYSVAERAVRNNYGGWVGTQLTVGSSSLNVSSLGRLCLSGNSSTHTVKFVSPTTGLDVPGGSAIVNMAGCVAGQFVYTSLAAPISLQAGAGYYIASLEVWGGDTWYDLGGVSTTSDATVPNSVYNGGGWITMGTANTAYVPPNFQYSLSAASGATFITSYAVSGRVVRNDYSGWVGTQLTVGSKALNVSSVGRLCLTGNSGTHTVKFASASTGLDATGGSAVVNMAGCTAGQFVYTSLAAPISLQAGASYFVASLEVSGGDNWYDLGGVSTTSDATVLNSVYNGGSWVKMGGASTSYVPPNFQYSLSSTSGAAFITSYATAGRAVRNDYGGWVGTQLTVGSNPLTVTSVGRLCLSINSGTHAVKFASVSTGLDVSGGSALVNLTGCTPGQFVYTSLAAPITLQAGLSYYFASQEVAGGDTWYDLGGVSTTSDALATNSIYFNGNWIGMSTANTSYVPPNFQYHL